MFCPRVYTDILLLSFSHKFSMVERLLLTYSDVPSTSTNPTNE